VSVSLIPERIVRIPVGVRAIEGDLWLPDGALGLIVFTDGSENSRFNTHYRFMARLLNKRRLATLLLDLVPPHEEALVHATDWLAKAPEMRALRPGYFGAGLGGALALVGAAARADRVGAVVSAAGRPDLADTALADVMAPTLLIAAEKDRINAELNREALARLRCTKELAIISGAAHLLEEPRALDEVVRLARDWFLRHLVAASVSA
jgi:dienelactone hydrolase